MKQSTSRFIIVCTAVMVSLALAAPVLALPADSIGSQHITEADGTSGQDTNTGNGIKAGHIQDGAVTNSKLADGAVTDAKLSGIISASKVPHDHDAVYQNKYANVVVVAKTGGDFTDPVEAVGSITDSSPDNPYVVRIMPGVYTLTTPLRMKPFVDIEGSGQSVTVLEGSLDISEGLVVGADDTEIRTLSVQNTVPASATYSHGIYVSDAAMKVRNVSVRVSGGVVAVGLYVVDGKLLMTDSDISVSEASNSSRGIINNRSDVVISDTAVTVTGPMWTYGITNWETRLTANDIAVVARDGVRTNTGLIESATTSTITDSSIYAMEGNSTWGINSQDSSDLVLRDVKVSATGAYRNHGVGSYLGGVIRIDHSHIIGETDSVWSQSAIYIGQTKLEGPIFIDGGSMKCVNAYDENYDPVLCQ